VKAEAMLKTVHKCANIDESRFVVIAFHSKRNKTKYDKIAINSIQLLMVMVSTMVSSRYFIKISQKQCHSYYSHRQTPMLQQM